MKRCYSFLLAVVFSATLSFAQDVVQPASVIQDLLDVAEPGSVVSVPAGTYQGALTIPDTIVVQGAGDGQTILDGQDALNVVSFGKESVLIGFTVRNGQSLINSKGNFIGVFECTLENFRRNGVFFETGAGVVANNVIRGDGKAVGILSYGANPLVINNLIENNAVGFQWFLNLIPSVVENLFRNNDVAIRGPEQGTIVLERNLFDNNREIGYRGVLPESNEVRSVAPNEFTLRRGVGFDAYQQLMDTTYEAAVKDHPIIIYDLHDEAGVFDAITLFPWATFTVSASAVDTVINRYEAYDWVADRQINAEFVRERDNRPSVRVNNPELVEKMRERYVLENEYVHPESYFDDGQGNRVFRRMTNLAQIEVVIPHGYEVVSHKPEGILHAGGERPYLSIQDVGVTHVEVILRKIAGP